METLGKICYLTFTLSNYSQRLFTMNKLVRGLIAAYGAKKLGGGCLGTIVVFFIIYMLLGHVHC